MSLNPKPSYHLCPSFTIPPPPNGHLDLGSILTNLDSEGIDNPLNIYSRVAVPDTHIYPRNGPDEKQGFTLTLKELRSGEAGIWAKIFAIGSAGFKFLAERSDDETLTVEKLLTRYFSPTREYMNESLESAHVLSYLEDTERKQPLYMVTGYMYVEGARLSRARNKNLQAGVEASATDLNIHSDVGGNAGYTRSNSSSSGFSGSTPFILGLRVRKISWEKGGASKMTDQVAGATLSDTTLAKDDVLYNVKLEDDAIVEGETIDVIDGTFGIGSSVWVIPSND